MDDQVYLNEDDAYDKILILLKNKKAIGHTTRIIEWMIAHNLLVNKINIPYLTNDQIDNMTQTEINQLAKLLTMNGNNVNNIRNILRFLHKLDEENITLLPEINDIILNRLYEVEKIDKDINFIIKTGSSQDILNLLKIHHNKRIIRELILENIALISENINLDVMNKNKNIYESIHKPRQERGEEESDDESDEDPYFFDEYYLAEFIAGLLELNEIGLARKYYEYYMNSNPYWNSMNEKILKFIHQSNEYYTLSERLFRILPEELTSEDLFSFFHNARFTVSHEIRLKDIYIPFLRAAIKSQKLDFINLLVEYFDGLLFRNSDCKQTKILMKEFEDLLIIAKEMI